MAPKGYRITYGVLLAFMAGLVGLAVWFASHGMAHRGDGIAGLLGRDQGYEIMEGPWGDLMVWDLRLEVPEEFITREELSPRPTQWNFGKMSLDQARNVLAIQGCSPAQADSLLQNGPMPSPSGEFIIQPPESAVLRLKSEPRNDLYAFLAQQSGNRYYQEPVYLPPTQMEKLLRENKFSHPEELRLLLQKLVYPRNGYQYFSDPEIILRHLANDRERVDFLRGIFAVDAVRAGLRVQTSQDCEKPLAYWTHSMPGVTASDLKPLLESFYKLKDPGPLSILYVLPPMARLRLYTTPRPEEVKGVKPPDCHWTAQNFFRREPDPRMSDNQYASDYIKNNFTQISQPSQPGDLLLLLNPQGQVLHSATYLAGNIYFTKNGLNVVQPWVLMREKDLLPLFSKHEPAHPAYFRKRDL